MGKKINFVCSHVDSLIGAKRPTRMLFPDQSYTKWNNVPRIKTNITPFIM